MSNQTKIENFSTTTIRTIALSKKLNLLELLPDEPTNEIFSWVRNNQGLVAWGITTEAEFSGKERFSRAHKWWKNFIDNCAIRDEVQTSGSGAIAFVSFSYEIEDTSVVKVPKIIIGQDSQTTWLTVIGNQDIDKIKEDIFSVTNINLEPHNITWSDGSISVAEWQSAVEKAVERINNKELDKVVLTRDLNAKSDKKIDVRKV